MRERTVQDEIAFVRRCLDMLDTELTRIDEGKKPVMSASGLLCPVLNAKDALVRMETALAHVVNPDTLGNAAATGEKPEVADAVIAEMRDEAARAATEQYYTLDDAAESMREYANRLEEALKRERAAFDCECAGIAELAAKEEAARHTPCNAAAMREALVKIRDKCVIYNNDLAEEIDALCGNALSAPPRQCDVGTADEQENRFREFCQAEQCGRCRCRGGSKSICIDRCAIDWTQTPCEAEEGAAQ